MGARHRDAGFTLIELLAVVTIIAVVASIMAPNVLEARKAANDTAAINVLHTIAAAETLYYASGREDPVTKQPTYAYASSPWPLANAPMPLSVAGLINDLFADPTTSGSQAYFRVKQGYRFYAIPSTDPNQTPYVWMAWGWPIAYGATGNFRFATNFGTQIYRHTDWSVASPGTDLSGLDTASGYIVRSGAGLPPDGQPYREIGGSK